MSETDAPYLGVSIASLRTALRAMARHKKKSGVDTFYPDFYSTDIDRYLKLAQRGAIFSFSERTHKLCWSVAPPKEASS